MAVVDGHKIEDPSSTSTKGLGNSVVVVKDVTNEDRILRRGDLARIIGLNGRLNDHHKGDLVRIVRSNPVKEKCSEPNQTGHAFRYDVELVLGGKLNSIPRSELQYTTAFAEGMTGDARQRRKRKPTLFQDETKEIGTIEKNPSASKRKKVNSANHKNKTKASSKTTSTKNSNNKKRGSKTAGSANGKKKSNLETTKATITNINNAGSGLGMYERHRREFERCLLRLQKLDVYGFFNDDNVPQEYDECYEKVSASIPDKASSLMMESIVANVPISHPTLTNASNPLHTPASSTTESENDSKKSTNLITFPNHPPYNFVVLRKRLEQGRYVLDRLRLAKNEENFHSDGTKISPKDGQRCRSKSFSIQHPFGIHWDQFRDDVIGMCNAAVERNSGDFDDGTPGTLSNATEKIKTAMEQIYEKTGRRQSKEMELSNDAHRFTKVIESVENKEAALQGKSWRKKAFPERQYERLKTDAVCSGLSELDERIASYELRTSLKDSFLGLSYTYNDTGQSEGWMKSMINEEVDKDEQARAAMALSSDDGVIKAQVAASMQSLLIAVQDRVMTESGVLEQKELRSANWECGIEKVGEQVVTTNNFNSDGSKPEIVEQPVWGIDCYTRKNISICLGTQFDHDTVLVFIEKWLLPAINACPVDLAYNLSNAARILEGLPFDVESSLNQRKGTTAEQWRETLLGKALLNKIKDTGPPWLHCAAKILRKAIGSMGHDFFRVHPKGHGSIVLSPKIEANRLVTFYRGEVYPSWRWGEKMDAISLIQQRNNLKPRLPDFYNMALERPQMDPRGYGLLFVDASRKSGYGSMLSHSCNPSCEVRVAAVNGKLTLAMTTLRCLTIGDEVTFDYNAVTESLHEYQAAVCLCGQGQCRGSFLHFATADCYQQVLNRNFPVAVRLSQLIKGCMKKVMSDEDVATLKRHGFQTAAFGAVSVNRRKATNSTFVDSSLDSMDFVPIWLRTHVADILRYIEYERRALPIALISNQISRDQDQNGTEKIVKNGDVNVSFQKESSQPDATVNSIDEKPVKGSKPEPTFFYFLRRKRESYISSLIEHNKNGSMTGGEIEREIKKMASAEWKSFDDKMKQRWKEQAIADWEKNGGKEKARLEQHRLKKISQSKSDGKSPKMISSGKSKNLKTFESSRQIDKQSKMQKMSFQAADAEGVTAMEQRIQQVTQALSRVGRVLDRHREELLRKPAVESEMDQVRSPAELRELAHSPIAILPDEHVVAWMWNHENGIVRTLLRMTERDVCVSPDIRLALKRTELKYNSLVSFGTPWVEGVNIKLPMTPIKGRQLLDEALMEFRATLVDGIRDMAVDIKNSRAEAREVEKKRKEKAGKHFEEADKVGKISTSSSTSEIRYAVKFILNSMMDKIEEQTLDTELEDTEITKLWLNNYNKRFKMEKAADLLLMYRRTSTFFRLIPYESLKSTPIEVYAREVGNAVPRSVIERKESPQVSPKLQQNEYAEVVHNEDSNKAKSSKEAKKGGLCEPEDIISEVVVEYQGDYVLSQLLQWYNAGIDQNPGLPDILGCGLLPSMAGCWTIDPTKGSNSATGIRTKYQSHVRPKLVEWFKDPFKRGSPWTDELRRSFVTKDDYAIGDASKHWLPIGSPVLDFLVTGDDYNLMDVLSQLGTESTTVQSNQSDGLLSSVDHGRPAQAVSNWIQCENPECQKWRKIPWHVDIDMLSKKFVCSDHIWGLNPRSCDAPEDDWDETTDACVEADGSVKPNDGGDNVPAKNCREHNPVSNEFRIGSRFDVLRPGKEKWSIANVVDVSSKKIKFHFVKTQAKNDVWLEKSSHRIATLHTHTKKPKLQTKSDLSCVLIQSNVQAVRKKAYKVNESKTSQLPMKMTQNILPSSGSSKKYTELITEPKGTETYKARIRVENEDESDGLSFAEMDDEESKDEDDEDSKDEDDEDSDDEVCANEEFDKEDHIPDSGKFKEKVRKPPTVTDVSSSDGSLKRDFESTHVENSDVENEFMQESDQSNSGFKIPKKKKSEKKPASDVIPKKLIPKKTQASVARGTSLISDAARQAMLEKKREKKSLSYTRRPISLNPSPSKDTRQADRMKMCSDHSKNPILKRQASSEFSPSQNHRTRSPSKYGSQSTESPFKNGKYCQSIISPRHSFNDKYSIEQRRERELYRDSNEYTTRGQDYCYQDPSDSRDSSVNNYSPKRLYRDQYSTEDRRERDLYHRYSNEYRDRYTTEQRRERDFYRDSNEYSDRYSSEQGRERDFCRKSKDCSARRDCSNYQNYGSREYSIPNSKHKPSDHERGIEKSAGKSYNGYRQREQYEADHDESNTRHSESRYLESSSERPSRNIPSIEDVECDHNIIGFQNSRRIDGAYHEDHWRYDDRNRRNEDDSFLYDPAINEGDSSQRARGFNERERSRDIKFQRGDDGHDQTYPVHSDDDGFYRDDNRHNSRRRRSSGSRREKRRKRKFDGSDEYSRRLGSYNHPQGRSFFDEAAEREHCDR